MIHGELTEPALLLNNPHSLSAKKIKVLKKGSGSEKWDLLWSLAPRVEHGHSSNNHFSLKKQMNSKCVLFTIFAPELILILKE